MPVAPPAPSSLSRATLSPVPLQRLLVALLLTVLAAYATGFIAALLRRHPPAAHGAPATSEQG